MKWNFFERNYADQGKEKIKRMKSWGSFKLKKIFITRIRLSPTPPVNQTIGNRVTIRGEGLK